MDRTRLRYNMTAEGLAAFHRNATQYAKDSLKIYRQLRSEARKLIEDLLARGVESVYLDGEDEQLDIFRLSCLEQGLPLDEEPRDWIVSNSGNAYHLRRHNSNGGKAQ